MRLTPQPRFRFYGSPGNHLAVAAAALTSGIGRSAEHLARLEERVAERTGAAHALCVPQARVGLYLAVRSLIRPGQKVILSPYTIYDVVNMVVCAGGRPVFADIEPDTCNIDPREVEHLIDGDTGAVIATHLHGLACDIGRLVEVCRDRGVALIEDAAQCFGGRVDGRHVGTFGDVGVFSFGRAKNVNALYGGMVVTNDRALRDRMAETLRTFPPEDPGRLLRRAGQCLVGDLLTAPLVFQTFTFWLFRYDRLHDLRVVDRLVQAENNPTLHRVLPEAYRRRMTPLQARLVARQLPNVDRHARIRIDHARTYHRGLSGLPKVGLPPLREDGSHIYLAFPIRVPERSQFVKHLLRRGRDMRAEHCANAADLPCFSAYARDCPNARATVDRVVLLPTYPGYARAEVERNIAAIVSYFCGSAALEPAGGAEAVR